MSPRQVETMFDVIDKEKNTELHTLNLVSVNLSTVDSDILARVVARMKNAILTEEYRMTHSEYCFCQPFNCSP